MAAAQNVTPIQRVPMEEVNPPGLPPELQEKLKAPLPPEAVTQHPTKKYLSSIKPAFVIERMNDVFGIGGYTEVYREISVNTVTKKWKDDEGKIRDVTLFVGTVHATLEIRKYGIHMENFGGSENEDAGDALKGACTDAFTKICSHLGVGLEVYKGRSGGGEASALPACPGCKKQGAIIKGKAEYGGGYVCFGKKGGCGAKFTDAEMEQIKSGNVGAPKPPKAATVPAPANPNPDKITVEGVVSDVRITTARDLLRLKLNDRECATRMPDLIKRLENTNGRTVTLLLTPLTGRDGVIHQIQKVIGWKAGVQ